MASRSLILHRLTSHFAVGIKQNQRLLISSRFHSCTRFPDTVHMTSDCVQRMKQLKAQDKVLRLRIELGGRLGFRYVFDVVDDKTNPDDRVIKRQGVKLLVDNVSYNVVNGATVDYVYYTTPPTFENLPRSPDCSNIEGGIAAFFVLGCKLLAKMLIKQENEEVSNDEVRARNAQKWEDLISRNWARVL